MSESFKQHLTLPPEQQAIRDKCFHPSGTFVEFPMEDVETSIPARFEKIVRMYPERIAVKDQERERTYFQLNQLANNVARRLERAEEIDGYPLALLFENGVTLFASILGVLKAGKFFVLLNPALPTAQNYLVIKHSGARVILTDSQNIGSALQLADNGCRWINVESIEPDPSNDKLSISLSSQQLAYIAYTSGSTGEPKGVMNTHRKVLYDVALRTNAYHISNSDRLSLIAAVSSHAINNMFFALLNGATLLPFNLKGQGLPQLARWLIRERITICRLTIQLFREFCRALTGNEAFVDMRLIQFAGDTRFLSDVTLWRRYFPSTCLLANGISSSETGYLTDFLFDHAIPLDTEAMPAGYAVNGKDILVLDDNGRNVDANQIGELAVKSSFISPGYWRRPDLTHSKFKSDANGDDRQIFLTGDFVLRLPDGALVYKGRKDSRIKLRGHNVDPAEVENTLRQHKSVRQAGVAPLGDDQATDLVAYVVPEQPAPSVDELRRFLVDKLAEYMIPVRFVFIETLPLINGKLDRKALPLPGRDRPDLAQRYIAAQSASEQKLVVIWQEVLRTQPVGIHDNFFDLGGHSLLAMRIQSAVNRAFGVEISMRNLLDVPTVAELATQIEELRTIGEQSQLHTLPRPLRSASVRGGTLPLSYAEEGLWLLEQIRPGLSAWNMQSRLRLRGPVDLKSLQCSLNTLVQRQETLRTAYRLVDEKPARVIVPELTVELEMSQLDPSSETDAEIDRISIADKKQPFALAEAPLFRVRLVSVNKQDHVLIVTKHHIITDAWSSNVFIREFFSLYDAYTTNRPLALTDLPVQYSDYALWMRQFSQDPMEDQLSYWREKLKGCIVQEIPTDMRRPLERSYRGGQERFQLSKEYSRALQGLCKKERSTLFMLLVATFKILLSRYTGSSDVVVGSTLAGRTRPELENLIGMFINILTLRTDLSGNPTFRELLGRVRETCLEAYQHQDMAFEKLVQALNPGQGLNHNPFFQVLFNVVNAPPVSLALDHLTVESIPRPDDTARFDLSLYALQNHDGIELKASYNRNLFNQERIVEMLEQYKFLLEQIVNNPDQTIDQYSLVTPSAQRLLPDPSVPLDDNWQGAVHDLIARHAEWRPDKAALEDPFGVWSYKELNDLSNQIAHWLIAQRIKRGDIVAVHGQRSAILVSTLLGILKAGTAFCVIDPKHPAGRVKAYLSETRPKAFIEIGGEDNPHAEMEEVLRGGSLHSRLQLPGTDPSEPANILSQYSTKNPQIYVGPDDPAYIIFTSGSTGQPKGVMGRHGPLTHFLPWLTETFGLADNDHFSFLSSLSTNKLQREIFTALALGATLHIPSDDTIGSFGTLDEWLRQKEISVVHLTPAMVQLLHDTARESIPSVRRVFFGGDLLQMRDVNLAKSLMPQADIANFYNSSETQRGGGYFIFSKQNVEHQKDIPPLGQGVKDVQLLVLNQIGTLAGVCEVGEICVRSPHLALGYLGDEALTKERFIINPYSGHPGDRIYRTGELGRYLPDGNVEFVARGENQVSIRGYRVDLGEIESVLKSHTNISNAVVSPHDSSSDRLIAHLVPKSISIFSIDEIRVFLRTRLPNHMIPAAFVIRDSLPLTATGKIDRRLLAAFNLDKIDEQGMLASPRNPIEESLANIWSKVLNLDKVGIHNNFFDLGGHSLLAIRVMSLIRDVIGVDLPLRVLFEAPTIADLAVIVTQNQTKPLNDPESAQILRDVESMTEEEAQKILST